MAKPKLDANSMFADPTASLLTEEEHAVTPGIVGPSAKDALGLRKYPVRNVLVADIIKDSDIQFREKPFDPEKYEKDLSLVETMRGVGLLQPIMVQEIEGTGVESGPFGIGKKYQLVFGHKRRAAAVYLGWEKIQAHVAPPDEDVSVFTLIENDSREELSPYELAMTIKKYAELHPGVSQTDIAERIGKTQGYVSRLFRVLEKDVPKPLVELFAGGLSAVTVLKLQPLYLAVDTPKRDRLTDALKGCSNGQIERIVAAVDEKVDLVTAVEMFAAPLPGIGSPAPALKGDTSSAQSVPAQAEDPEQPGKPVDHTPASKLKAVLPTKPPEEKMPRLPSGIVPGNDVVVEKLASDNGTSKALVRALITKAQLEDLSLEELENACVISAVCGDATKAVNILSTIMSDKRALSGFLQYTKAVRLLVKTMYVREKEGFGKISLALRDGVFAPLPLVDAKKEKKG